MNVSYIIWINLIKENGEWGRGEGKEREKKLYEIVSILCHS